MERRQLEFFLAIAEAGSFTRASQVLHIAQPSLRPNVVRVECVPHSPQRGDGALVELHREERVGRPADGPAVLRFAAVR